ncbi:MAG: hypothetical protein K2K53_01395 [Oscillospiraceae bacterium]|nr:hypothetical protein [Oscillospiraceae bacterium]
MEEQARLVGIEHDCKITKETDSQFLFEYQRAILLSLKEGGALDEAQYRYAEEKLKSQLRASIRKHNSTEERGEKP